MKQIKNLVIDLVLVFGAAYVAQLQTGNGAVTSLWALLAAALAGAANALNPANRRYGIGAGEDR
jgi:hypothetical protein